MKKLFFSILTLVAVVCAISSCGDDSSNDVNIPDKKANLVNFKYKAALSNDVLDFYDVNITRTAEGKTVTYSLNKSYTIQHKETFSNKVIAEYAAKTMDKDSIMINKGELVTVTATFTVKDNWQSVLDARAEGKIDFKYEVDKVKPLTDGSTLINSNMGGPGFNKKSEITKDILDKYATTFAKYLSMN